MRTWILGLCLSTVTAAGVYTVLSGTMHSASCRPCAATPVEAEPQPVPPPCEDAPLVQVVDVSALLAPPPAELPRPAFVSFDEPPLAKPPGRPAPEFIPVSYTEPVTIETAPAPRRVATPGPIPLATPSDAF